VRKVIITKILEKIFYNLLFVSFIPPMVYSLKLASFLSILNQFFNRALKTFKALLIGYYRGIF